MENENQEFGAMVDYHRKKHGLTIADLARLSTLSKGQVCKLLKNGGNPTLTTIKLLANALDVIFTIRPQF